MNHRIINMASRGLIDQNSERSEYFVVSSSNKNRNNNRSNSGSNNNRSSSGSNSKNNGNSRASGSSTFHESGNTSTTPHNHDYNKHTRGATDSPMPTPAKAKSEETSHSVSETVLLSELPEMNLKSPIELPEYSTTIPNTPAETSERSSSRQSTSRSTSTNKVKKKVTWTANENKALMAAIIEERKDSIRDTDDMDECIWEIGNGLSSSEDDWNVIDWDVVSASMMNSKSAVECLTRYLKISK